MIGDYLVVALVFGIVVSYVAIIHRFWLRDAFKEEAPLNVPAKREGTCEISTPRYFPRLKSRALSQTQVPGGLRRFPGQSFTGQALPNHAARRAVRPQQRRLLSRWAFPGPSFRR